MDIDKKIKDGGRKINLNDNDDKVLMHLCS